MQLIAFVLAAGLAALPSAALAADYTIGALQIGSPWTRATPRGADVAGGFMTITNKGATTDRLVSGSSTVANRFEVHRMSMEDGVMKMRPIEGGLEIKAGQTVDLKPGSFHVMFIGLKEPLQQGQRVKGTLVFQSAGTVDVEFAVEPLGATAPGRAAPTGPGTPPKH